MYTHSFNLSSRAPCALVMQDDHFPVFWINFFLSFKKSIRCTEKSLKTYTYDLAQFAHFIKYKKIDFIEVMSNGDFLNNLELISLSNFLSYSADYINPLVDAGVSVIKFDEEEIVSASSKVRRIKIAKEFLAFCAEVIPSKSGHFIGKRVDLLILIDHFKASLKENLKGNGRTSIQIKEPLSDEQFKIINKYLEAYIYSSPRRKILGLRNIIVFHLLHQTGARIGEILGLRLNSICREDDGGIIVNLPDKGIADDDGRPNPATSKTGARPVKINDELGRFIKAYIDIRLKTNGGIIDDFLLVNEKGIPITDGGVRYVFSCLNDALGTSIHPHYLRSSWATTFILERAQEAKKLPHQFRRQEISTAIDLLRVQMGWSEGSSMPQHYARYAFRKLGDDARDYYSNSLNAEILTRFENEQ